MPVVASVAVAAQCGLLLLSSGCLGEDVEVPGAPLGWSGPLDAEEVRVWPGESLAAAPRWRVAQEPKYSMVLDSVDRIIAGQVIGTQRFVVQGAFLPDGKVVLLYSIGGPSQADPLLLHLVDPASGEAARIPAPKDEAGESLGGGSVYMATVRQGFVVASDKADYSAPGRPRRWLGKDVLYADRDGRFTRSPSYVNVDGGLLGTFADGSLVMWTMPVVADTTIVTSIVSVRVTEGLSQVADSQRMRVLFTTANPRDPGRYDSRASWAPHPAWVTAVAGDTIWVVPTERPELVAVHRSGGVALKVEWEAGDRTVPPGASEFWDGAERFPAAVRLRLGADGSLYVRRWEMIDDRYPGYGREWLVFTHTGELVARLDIPLEWRVLAFGPEKVLAVVSEDGGPAEVRVHAIERLPG